MLHSVSYVMTGVELASNAFCPRLQPAVKGLDGMKCLLERDATLVLIWDAEDWASGPVQFADHHRRGEQCNGL